MNYITGGNGFIGSALRRRIPDLKLIPHARIFDACLKPYSRLFFLSAYGNMYGQTDIGETIRANVLAPLHLIDHSPQPFGADTGMFVFISSSSCRLPVKSNYACSKLSAEENLLHRERPVCIIRPYSVTGVGEQVQHLIPCLIRSCMEGEPISLTPRPVHDFVDVEDICRGIDSLSAQGATGIFELGTGVKTSNEEVLCLVEQVTRRNANVRIVNTNLREYDSEDWVCRDMRAQSFGWTPTKTLKQSITEMVEAYCAARD